ncbi:hypothetical protein BGW38_009105, partial [Lunasporangiospora selenospora]
LRTEPEKSMTPGKFLFAYPTSRQVKLPVRDKIAIVQVWGLKADPTKDAAATVPEPTPTSRTPTGRDTLG